MSTIIKIPLSVLNNGGIESEYAFEFSGDPTWKDRASCLGDTAALDLIMFPKAGVSQKQRHEAIVRVCGSCPVKDDCYKYGEESGAVEGVWGGVIFRKGKSKDLRRLKVV